MKRRLLLILVAALLVSAVVVISFAAHRKEPKYKGKSLSAWLKAYDRGPSRFGAAYADAAAAVRSIGTNALPLLLADLQYQTPGWVEKVSDTVQNWPVIGPLWDWTEWSQDRAWRAELGFEILGADAAPAVPHLIRLLDKDKNIFVVGSALSAIGEPALYFLIVTLTNRANSDHVRARAAEGLSLMGTNANDAVEGLVASLEDEPEVSMSAAFALERVVVNREALVPRLVDIAMAPKKSLSIAAITVLGGFGTNAHPAVPVLEGCLTNDDSMIRSAATNALIQITTGTGTPAPGEEPFFIKLVRPAAKQ